MVLGIAAATATQAFWFCIPNLRGVGYPATHHHGFGAFLVAAGRFPLATPTDRPASPSAANSYCGCGGKHVFNPANFGVGIALLFLPGTWVSPGQWGNDPGLVLVALGATVASRSRRSATTRRGFLFWGLSWDLCPAPAAPWLFARGWEISPSSLERCPAALRLLHDLRPHDPARPPHGPPSACGAGHDGGVGMAVPPSFAPERLLGRYWSSPLVPLWVSSGLTRNINGIATLRYKEL